MSAPSPVTPATIRRLLYALGGGALVVAATSIALTAGQGTAAGAVFAMCAASLTLAAAAFEWTEHRAAVRQARVAAAEQHAEDDLESPEARRRHHEAVEGAIVALSARTDEVVQSARRAVDAGSDEAWMSDSREIAVVAVDALLDEPELLDALHRAACARELADARARANDAGVDESRPDLLQDADR